MSTDHSSVEGGEIAATEADKINTGALGTLVTVGLFAMLSITAAVTALVRHDIEAEEAIKDADANQVVTDLKAKQHEELSGPAKYISRSKGVVSLPIDVAKGLVVAELQRDPSSATPPKADAAADATAAAGGAGGASGSAAAGAGGASGAAPAAAVGGAPAAEGKGTPAKPEQGRDLKKPTTADSAKPSAVPTPTPTAATPGAQAPGPIKK